MDLKTPLLLALGVLILGCGGQEDTPAPPPPNEVHMGGTFRLAQPSPGSLDPAFVDDVYESAVINQVFDGLVAFDDNLNTIPSVAESWRISRDGTEYVFHLKEGVRFHDGSEVTAHDFVFSFTRAFDLDPDKTLLARDYLSHIDGSLEYAAGEADRIRGLEALSDRDLRVSLDRPFVGFLAVLAMDLATVVPQRYLESVGDEEFGRNPIGCGPFALQDWIPHERIRLRRYDGYHGRTVRLDEAVFELAEEGTRDFALRSFLEGELTILELPAGRAEQFRADGYSLSSRQELSLSYLALNQAREPFKDARVRKAFYLAIDREHLFGSADNRLVADGILPPGMPGFSPDRKLPAHNLEAARHLLGEAGYPGGEGLPPIVHITANQTAEAYELYGEIAGQLARVGFVVKNRFLTWSEYERLLVAGEAQCFSLNWVADIPDPEAFLPPLFHGHGSSNYANYANPVVDRLLEGAVRERSSRERLQIYREAERMILDDVPVVPLFHTVSVVATRPEVRGLTLTPMGMSLLPLDRVWFEPVQVAQESGQ